MASARSHIDQGEPATAAIEIKTLLAAGSAAETHGPALRELLGQALLASGDPAGAEIEFKRVLQGGANPDQVVPQLARALLAQHKHAELLSAFGETQLGSDEADAALRTARATAHRNRGELADARAEVQQALTRKPEHVSALLLQASLLAADNRHQEAIDIIANVIAREPDNVQAWTIRGQMLAAEGKFGEAVAAFEQALKLKPDSVSAHAALVVLELSRNDTAAAKTRWVAMSKSLPNNPQTQFHEAKVAFAAGDLRRARELTVTLLRSGQHNLALLQLAGAVELKLKAPARAESLLGKAVALAPAAPVPRLMLAQAHLANGQAAKATQVLRPLLEATPALEQAMLMAAEAALMQGEAKAAEALFAQAAKLYPQSKELAAATAVRKVRDNLSEHAIHELSTAVADHPDRHAQLILVSARLAKGQVEEARATLRDMAQKAPRDPFPLELAGRVALQQGKTAEARKLFEAALTLDASHYPAVAGLAGIDLADHRADQALAHFRQLLAREPDHVLALMAIAEIHERQPQGHEEAAKWLERAAVAHPDHRGPAEQLATLWMKQQKFSAAAMAAERGLSNRPEDLVLLELLGKAQLADGQVQRAAVTYGRMANLTPRSPEAWLRVAEIQLSAGRLAAANDAAAQARKAAPGSLAVMRMQAGLAARGQRFAQALAAARDAQSAHPDDAAGHLIEGEVLLLKGDEAQAERAWKLALTKRNPSEAAQRLHALWTQQGRTADADNLVAQWQSRHPKDMAFLIRLAHLQIGRKDYAGAEAVLRKVHQQVPRNVDVLNNIAWLLTQQRKRGGVAFAERAMVFSPNNPALLDTLAMAYATERRYADAIQAQSKAVALVPESGPFGLNLAKIYLMAGDKRKAADVLEGLATRPFAGQAEARQLLSSLRRG